MESQQVQQERLKTMLYYVGGKVVNLDHDEKMIDWCLRTGYLKSGFASGFKKTYKTTVYGHLYLYLHGEDVEIPEIRGGKICWDEKWLNH